VSAAGVTAVVLNWRTPEHTVRAVEALVADGMPPQRIVVVDNGSGDQSAAQIRRVAPDVHLLTLPQNIGFAAANNAGARELIAESAYLFVNSDAFVRVQGSVARLLESLNDRRVGVAVPRLRNHDLSLQRTVVPLSTPLPELVRASGFSRFVPNRLQPYLGTYWDHGHSRRISAAIGPVLLVRATAWDQLGGFSEREFMYAEDLDLFWRAAALGWRAQFVAGAEFIHLGGVSAVQQWDDAQRAERIARAEAKMLREHMGPFKSRLTLALMAAGVGGRALFYRVAGNRIAASTQRAWLRGYVSPVERARAPRA
jgi:N-acetylglucosaminyl-diphospho-decaprenol L-rhamnosyltransferase